MSQKLITDIHYYSVAGTGKKPKKFNAFEILDNGKTMSLLTMNKDGEWGQTNLYDKHNTSHIKKVRKLLSEIEKCFLGINKAD